MLLVVAAALLLGVRRPRLVAVGVGLGAVALFAVAVVALRGGTFLPVAPALATLLAAAAVRWGLAAARRRKARIKV
jgi:CHASE2 domain-containing sensor protein